MDQVLKAYKYISDAKVDVLYAQIPKRSVGWDCCRSQSRSEACCCGGRCCGEKNFAFGNSLLTAAGGSKYLEKHQSSDIGTIDAPKAYFQGILPMHWRLIPPPPRDQPKLVYWGGPTEHTLLGLGGCPWHMIGQAGNATMGESSSALPGEKMRW